MSASVVVISELSSPPLLQVSLRVEEFIEEAGSLAQTLFSEEVKVFSESSKLESLKLASTGL